eukprot:TRINITY_DN1517_c0_g1_i2.p2 TRINITY_DN1517_c0_g1~~TRINITY_DN1517_c0_g1_i2.p2  ORF type:complete len:480 (-),score=127.74 TRINITY_DN1517_c0_g1_i2:91-1530(-)
MPVDQRMGGIPSHLPPLPSLRKPSTATKALFWTKIPGPKVEKSIWIKERIATKQTDAMATIDEDEVVSFFAKKPQSIAAHKERDPMKQKKMKLSVLTPTRSQNISVILRSGLFKSMTLEDIRFSIISMNDNELTLDHVQRLLDVLPPTDEERKALKSLTESKPKDIELSDRFLIAVQDITRVSQRLSGWIFIKQFKTRRNGFEKDLCTLQEIAQNILHSKRFPLLLQVVLAFGNFLNGGTPRGQAYGFKMDTLLKLETVRASDGRTTLLDYIVRHVRLHEPNAAAFCEDFKLIMNETSLAFSTVLQETSHFVSSFKSLVSETEKHASAYEMMPGDLFLGKATDFVRESSKNVEKLTELCESIPSLLSKIAVLFGENTSSFDMDKFVELLRNFMNSFTKSMKALDVLTTKSLPKEEKLAGHVIEEAPTRRDSHRPIVIPGLSDDQKGLLDAMVSQLTDGSAFRSRRKVRNSIRLSAPPRK